MTVIQSDNNYALLRQTIRQRGLFERQLRFYASQAILVSCLILAGIGAVLLLPGFLLKLSGAALLALALTHLGFIVHDAGHRQIFSSVRANNAVLLITGCLAGVSPSWWVKTHNRHHSYTNDPENDPHMAIPALAFSPDQAEAKRGPIAFITRFQAYYFFPLLMLEGFGLRLASVQFIAGGKARHPMIEAGGMIMHLGLYVLMLLATMSALEALAFIVVHHALTGLYMGSVFAPNHKGMPLLGRDEPVDFLSRQLITTRNVRPHPITDFCLGGLNYQIEHHLFPTVPRNKLKETRLAVLRFCEERSLPYLETGLFESYGQVLRSLDETAEPLRRPSRKYADVPTAGNRDGVPVGKVGRAPTDV